MDVYQPDRRPPGKARERAAARQQRRSPMATPSKRPPEAGTPLPASPTLERKTATSASDAPPRMTARPGRLAAGGAAVGLAMRDMLWRVRRDRRYLLAIVAAFVGVIGLYLIVQTTQNRVFPNVWSMGVNLGTLTEDEAVAALQREWDANLRIRLIDEERAWDVTPAEFGLRLDARATAQQARAVGLGGVAWDQGGEVGEERHEGGGVVADGGGHFIGLLGPYEAAQEVAHRGVGEGGVLRVAAPDEDEWCVGCVCRCSGL